VKLAEVSHRNIFVLYTFFLSLILLRICFQGEVSCVGFVILGVAGTCVYAKKFIS